MSAHKPRGEFSLDDADSKVPDEQPLPVSGKAEASGWFHKAVSSGINFVREATGIGTIPAIDLASAHGVSPDYDEDDEIDVGAEQPGKDYKPSWNQGPPGARIPKSEPPPRAAQPPRGQRQPPQPPPKQQRANVARTQAPASPGFQDEEEFTRFSRVMSEYKKEQQVKKTNPRVYGQAYSPGYHHHHTKSGSSFMFKLLFLALLGGGGYYGLKAGRAWLESNNGNFARFIKQRLIELKLEGFLESLPADEGAPVDANTDTGDPADADRPKIRKLK